MYLHEHLRHFVTALSAPDVNDNITVREFGQRLRNDRFPSTERARDRSRPALHTGEERVQHSLARQQRVVRRKFVRDRAGRAYGPDLHERVLCGLPVEFGLEHGVFDAVGSFFGDARDCTEGAGVEHDFVVVDEGVFVYGAEDVATGDMVSDLGVM